MSNLASPAAHRIFHAINSGDLSCIPECVTADFVDHGSPFPIPAGPEGYTRILRFVTDVLRIQYTIEELIETADRIVVRATARGSGVADFHGSDLVGVPYEMQTLHIYRTQDDLLAEHWGVRDELGAMRRMEASVAAPR
ncbi:ester cyclase [Cumulibacter manganitolerans]|uniref:ester cyclase n=1 Tax=Cumulibacter manganitolerans TaxID=1884992 RepID=UPI001297D925|nr:ester cyclase [Cumulibacter manganitolerans]